MHRLHPARLGASVSMLALLGLATPAQAGTAATEVIVTAHRTSLMRTAETSSQGVVTRDELALLPAYRPGQLLETVPGLVVTAHSGEGKANQYLLRGFSLDHGTDLATSVEGMPVNERTHAHGQGYTDLNFLVPELVGGLSYTKGPYFAEAGDFASVGAVRLTYVDDLPATVSVTGGNFGFRRLFAGGTVALGQGRLLVAGEDQAYDGPWVSPDAQKKANAVLRYSQGDTQSGFDVTAMYYGAHWNATTDQPVRAMSATYMAGLGLSPIARFGTLDDSDGGKAQRVSLSGEAHRDMAGGQVTASAYAVENRLVLWNDFTHLLADPVNGDQHGQHENRLTLGGAMAYDRTLTVLGVPSDLATGVQARFDDVHLDLTTTVRRVETGVVEDDRVGEGSAAIYGQLTSHWTPRLRTVLGLRADAYTAHDDGTNSGKVDQALAEPKASLIYTVDSRLELYISAGQGFHSNDVRGSTQAGVPLLTRANGSEIGLRAQPFAGLAATVTLFQIDFASELTYDADAGETEAGPASHRTGYEVNLTYSPVRFIEFYGSLASARARFRSDDDDGLGHVGRYVSDAPSAIGQFGAYLRALGPWSGALEYRYLGGYPLVPDNSLRGKGYGEWNLDVSYAFARQWQATAGIYNLFDTRANAAEFYYGDRIAPTEAVPASGEGIGDLHIHPLEPRAFRLGLKRTFGL